MRKLCVVLTAVLLLTSSADVFAAQGKRLSTRTIAPRAHGRRILNCDEAGLCKKGEKRFLLHSENPLTSSALKYAFSKGCKPGRRTRQKTAVVCPAGVNVPNAQPDRVFQTDDLFSSEQIGALAVNQQNITGDGVLVAVLDTGIDANHPELLGRVNIIRNFTQSPEADAIGHGTHVSGIIAGQASKLDASGNRVLGISPRARLIIGKVCTDEGYCLESDIAAGIEWAVQSHARVINLSLGGGPSLTDCDDDPMAQLVNWAADQGVVVVAAAGNSGSSGEGVAVPACASKVIAVGAVDSQNGHPVWSSYGAPLDVVAPGVAILSAVPGNEYAQWSGTSMASPHVAGAVALLLHAHPSLTPAEVHSVLTQTARDVGSPGFDTTFGYGLIDMQTAVAFLGGDSSSSSSFESSASSSSETSSSSTSEASSSSSSSDSSESSFSSDTSTSSSSSSSSSSDSSASSASSSSASSSSAKVRQPPPPFCTIDAWACTEYVACSRKGKQRRLCVRVDFSCRLAKHVRPQLTRACTPEDRSRLHSIDEGLDDLEDIPLDENF